MPQIIQIGALSSLSHSKLHLKFISFMMWRLGSVWEVGTGWVRLVESSAICAIVPWVWLWPRTLLQRHVH